MMLGGAPDPELISCGFWRSGWSSIQFKAPAGGELDQGTVTAIPNVKVLLFGLIGAIPATVCSGLSREKQKEPA